MTENMKKFLELMSTKDKEIKEKAAKMEKDELIAFAADHGLTLTGVDFEKPDSEGEISLDEAEAVAGGGECYCVAGGGGTGGGIQDGRVRGRGGAKGRRLHRRHLRRRLAAQGQRRDGTADRCCRSCLRTGCCSCCR